MNLLTQKLPNSEIAFEMIKIEGGVFSSGISLEKRNIAYDARHLHAVQLSDFSIGKFPVTQAVYKTVMSGYNPSYFVGDERPVENVSWLDAAVFCNWLNILLGLQPCYFADANHNMVYGINNFGVGSTQEVYEVIIKRDAIGYRLPTQAEWEYAARGGLAHWKNGNAFSGSNKLKEVAWYNQNSHQETKPVGMKNPNALGIYDMSGNVFELCQDCCFTTKDKDVYPSKTLKNPLVINNSIYRVAKGGSWNYAKKFCHVASRYDVVRGGRANDIGFRLCFQLVS